MTYRQMWETYVEPNLRAQEELTKGLGSRDRSAPKAGPKKGTFDPTNLSADEMAAFLDKFCGKRKYTGPKWWLGEGGVKIYDGKK